MARTSDDEPDPFAHFDAAYVAGGLSGSERLAYERHLQHCERCAQAVRELAGLPGLLAKVPARPAEAVTSTPPPASLLDSLLAKVRHEQRRHRRIAVAGWVAAAAACLALIVTVAVRPAEPVERVGPPLATMTPLVQAPIHGSARIVDVPWGSRVEARCSYASGSRSITYALAVIDRDDKPHPVGTWNAKPGQTYRIVGATALTRREITAVEVRLTNGMPVLRWEP